MSNAVDDNKANVQLALSCWFLTGATASGKSQISLFLAERLNAEIISLDSMAIYRGMDIGTAKPSIDEQARLPHHLIDVVDPTTQFSVSQYRNAALDKVKQIQDTGKQVLFVGGTALYLKALLRGLFDGPPADWDFRKQIESEIAGGGAGLLHQRLEMVDPVAASNLHPNDHRRIIRALEVYKTTGKPISHLQMEFDEGRDFQDCRVFTIRHDRAVLHERIENRVESMFEAGLIEEVKGLLETWGTLGHTASQAVGYREVIDFINGVKSEPEMVEQVKIRTRRFARHQETWFRGMSECEIIDLNKDLGSEQLADLIFEKGQAREVS